MTVAEWIAHLNAKGDGEVFDVATAALTVLSKRFREGGGGDPWYASNRALAELDLIRKMQPAARAGRR